MYDSIIFRNVDRKIDVFLEQLYTWTMKTKRKGLYVADVRKKYKDKEYCSHLVRRSYREGGKVKQETVSNITNLPKDTIELIRQSLKGRVLIPADEAIETIKSRSHGHVLAVQNMFQELGLLEIIARASTSRRHIIGALIIARILKPKVKVTTHHWWHTTTLAEIMGVEDIDVEAIHEAMDWLLVQKKKIENSLAKEHLESGGIALYNVALGPSEGLCCTLEEYECNRGKKKGKGQMMYGLLTDPEGRPVSVQAYPESTDHIGTLQDQLDTWKQTFGLDTVVLAVDCGLINTIEIEALKEHDGNDWVARLGVDSMKSLVEKGQITPSMFDETGLMEIYTEEYPKERLVVGHNPYMAIEDKRKRERLLLNTERELDTIVRDVAEGTMTGESTIKEAVERVLNTTKMTEYFQCTIKEGQFFYKRCEESMIQAEELDGVYALRTSVPKEKWPKEEVVRGYHSLARIEKGCRALKEIDLHSSLQEGIKAVAHLFLCILAYYVEWHLREKWQGYMVCPHDISKGDNPVYSFDAILEELSTIQCNENWIPTVPEMPSFYQFTKPNAIQKEILACLGVKENSLLGRQKKDIIDC